MQGKHGHLSREQKQLALRLHAKGWRLVDIAREIGCSAPMVGIMVRTGRHVDAKSFGWAPRTGSLTIEEREQILLGINRLYNRWRAFRGKEYFSLSKTIKARVKSAVSFVDRYEDQLKELAAVRGCCGIICGHIHTPADKRLENGVHYLNSGDWVESLTAIVEKVPGEFELIHYTDFQTREDLAGAIRIRESDFIESGENAGLISRGLALT